MDINLYRYERRDSYHVAKSIFYDVILQILLLYGIIHIGSRVIILIKVSHFESLNRPFLDLNHLVKSV